MTILCSRILLALGLATASAFAASGDAEKARVLQQYDRLIECKAIFGLASKTTDRRSSRAIANINATLKQLTIGRSDDRALNDVALRSVKLNGIGRGQFLDSLWRKCLSSHAPYGVATSPELTRKLSRTATKDDRIAAAKMVLAAPEKYNSLLLMMAAEPLLLSGQKDDGRFLLHAGALRMGDLGLFLDVHADQDMIQVMNWTRRGYGASFALDGLIFAHDTRVAAERALAWDKVTPNLDIVEAMQDADDQLAVRNKMATARCNYLASRYFGEAATSLELKERYDGDAERFRRELTSDVSHLDVLGLTPLPKDGALRSLGARQKTLVNDAKAAIVKASFAGDQALYEKNAKEDPAAACDLLLIEAKKLVP
jgi:hypothetical protein